MITFNHGTTLLTKVGKGSIKKNALVTVCNPKDYESYCEVKDSEGNTEVYKAKELSCFGVTKQGRHVLTVVGDALKTTKRMFRCETHISENVRSYRSTYELYNEFLYVNDPTDFKFFEYEYEELSDEQIIDHLINEILYDKQPGLQSTSLVGTSAKGIDKDPNYHDGHYVLRDGKEYTMSYCRNKVFIREGVDGGWYKGAGDIGRTVYEGEVDYNRIKQAKIKQHSVAMLSQGEIMFDQIPGVQELIIDHIKNWDRFKLNSEYDNQS